MSRPIESISRDDPRYPARLRNRLGIDAPPRLTALGNLDLLALPKTALFCSARCPGDAILRTHDQAASWRDTGRCIIGGFHSPVEKECLDILLRGKPSVIICLARSFEKLRLPVVWQQPMNESRLLILSCFQPGRSRVTAELASHRNHFVAALADEVWFAHITPGGQMEKLAHRVKTWP
ncbi:MAG: DNA-processing protein DprA [Pseudolabrys sp.]|nr:DNA-processing protein DprA [Pseudolabrys sp.]